MEYAPEAERNLVAALLLATPADWPGVAAEAAYAGPQDFADAPMAAAFSYLLVEPLDGVLVARRLLRERHFRDTNEATYFVGRIVLDANPLAFAYVGHYAREVRQAGERRRLRSAFLAGLKALDRRDDFATIRSAAANIILWDTGSPTMTQDKLAEVIQRLKLADADALIHKAWPFIAAQAPATQNVLLVVFVERAKALIPTMTDEQLSATKSWVKNNRLELGEMLDGLHQVMIRRNREIG